MAPLFDLPGKKKQIAEDEAAMNAPDFWDDQKKAQALIRRCNQLKSLVENYEKLGSELEELSASVAELGTSFDQDLADLVNEEYAETMKQFDQYEIDVLLSGPYDNHNAILEIHPGAGGTEAQDWADMLFRMYGRWAEKHGFKWQVYSYEPGEEAGLKSAMVKISGHNVYGLLKGEKGVHRLVRISPFDANARRHTSFASVNVVPEFGKVADVVIDPKDLRVDTFRSGGAGGQNVNKVSSAVRITHIPTGIVVQCEIERSQLFNKQTCMEMLADKLMQRKLEERDAKMKSIVGEQKNIEWGSQIRSYVFCPYTMVKDNRTDYSTADVYGVMDGDLDGFISAYLELLAKTGKAAA